MDNPSLTRAEIVEQLCIKFKSHRREASAIVDDFFTEIIAAVQQQEDVYLPSFGKLHYRVTKEKQGRNPKTGAIHRIPPKTVVKFSPSPKLVTLINGDIPNGHEDASS